MGQSKFDMTIIGSGPAGIYAAVQGAKFGKRVALIEKNPTKLGGAWLHTGTIPSKTLRESLETLHNVRFHVGQDWVQRLVQSMSAEQLFGRAFKVANAEEDVIREYLSRNKVELVTGQGILESANSVRVVPGQGDPYLIKSEKILIATGSRPRRPDDVPFDGWRVVDSDELLLIKSVPKTMVIYGAGVIGCEYACIFRGLGVDVTILDARTSIMRGIDTEVSSELMQIMESTGIKFAMSEEFESVRTEGPQAIVKSTTKEIPCDLFFFAAGRVSCTDNMGLERLDMKMSGRGAIEVNENFQTSLQNVYAAGDAIGSPALASTSAEQGRFACSHAFGMCKHEFPAFFPVGIYSIPELSSVGKSEEQLKEEKIDYVVGRATFKEVARGYIRGDNQGLLKMLIDKNTHKILGIHIVGPDAANLVHIGLSFMLYDGPVEDIVNRMIFNYPTLAEVYRIAAFNALNKIFPDGVFGQAPNAKKKSGKPKAA